MADRDFHIAQFNTAKLPAPLDDPQLAEFVGSLERINTIADESPGFVWLLQSESGDATSLRPLGDDVIVNMSVWRDIDALFDFVYRTQHAPVMAKRRQWFAKPEGPFVVLWWVRAGYLPTVANASAAGNPGPQGAEPGGFHFQDEISRADARLTRPAPLRLSHEYEIPALVAGKAQVGIFRRLRGRQHDRLAYLGKEALRIHDAAVLLQGRNERGSEHRMPAAAGIGHRLKPARGHHRAHLLLNHALDIVGVLDRNAGLAGQRARVAAVGHNHHVAGLDRLQHICDVCVRYPVGWIVLHGIDRQPIALVRRLVVAAVTGIVDQQIVVERQRLAQLGQRADDLVARRIDKQDDLEAVDALQSLGDGLGIAGSRFQPRHTIGVVVVADDQGLVAAEVRDRPAPAV